MDLFSNKEEVNPALQDAELSYFPQFLSRITADDFYKSLMQDLNWKQYNIRIFGKEIPQPRLTAFYGEITTPYTYSNLTLNPLKLTTDLEEIKNRIECKTGMNFTHCLANLYRDGNDSMGWHADDERELGKKPVIASVSFGGIRKFQLKHKVKSHLKYELDLEHGSLLIMKGTTQEYWKHQIPKTKKEVAPRINLTFRRIL